MRRVSLIAQVSLSLSLLLTAGLFLRVLGQFHTADPGFAVANRLYVTTYISAPEFTPESGRAFYSEVTDRLRALPGVSSVAITNILPLTPLAPNCAALPDHDSIPASVPATISVISPGFFDIMQAPIVAGRDFRAVETQPVVIVNEAMAKRLEISVGKRIQLGCRTKSTAEVIGIAKDLRFVSVGEPAKPHACRPFSQNYDGYQTIIVGQVPDLSSSIAESIRKTITATNPAARVYAVNPLSTWVDQSYWQIRWEVSVLSAFATLALVLAAVGLYGMIAYHVSLRRREIGVRVAIGAQASDVFKLILRQGLTSTLIGIAIGLTVSALITRALSKLLYGVSPTDFATYALASLLWLFVAAAACYLPARRASKLDPMEVLRNE
jgi:predicted permease